MLPAAAMEPVLPVLTVTDVKNYAYCPRVVYYHYFLAHRPVTGKMKEGKLEHVHQQELEERRVLTWLGLPQAERQLSVPIQSAALGLSGLLDEAIVAPAEVVVLEFKDSSSGIQLNHQLQLAAYGLLAQEHWQRPCRRGLIYLVGVRQRREIALTAALGERVRECLAAMREMLEREEFPPPTPRRGRCVDCEYRRYCNDVD